MRAFIAAGAKLGVELITAADYCHQLAPSWGLPPIMALHFDQPEALALSHRIAVMNHGVIEQLDEPDKLYGFPKNRFVADFIGNVNMLDA